MTRTPTLRTFLVVEREQVNVCLQTELISKPPGIDDKGKAYDSY